MKKFAIKLVTNLIPVKKYRRGLRNKLLTRFVSKEVTDVSILQHKIIDSALESNNKIILIENGIEKEVPADYFKGLKIIFRGKNNTIRIHMPIIFTNTKIYVGNESYFEILSTKFAIHNSEFYLGKNSKIEIGENFSCNGAMVVSHLSGNYISIGNDCMLGREIIIRADDGHPIRYKGSNTPFNIDGNVVIGNHVWIAQRAFIGKNVEIGDNSVVGACSVMIKGAKDSNVIWGGCPAKIIKRDIEWDR